MYKRELFYTILIFVLLELLSLLNDITYTFIIGIAGLLIIVVWIVTSISYYSRKKVSRFSDIMVKLEIRKRWYSAIFMPLVFYLALFSFITIVKDDYLIQFAILLGTIALFTLLIHIRSSFERAFGVEKNTRLIFDVINVVIFFLISSILLWTNTFEGLNLALVMYSLTLLMFLTNLLYVDKLSSGSFFTTILFGLIIGFASYFSGYLTYLSAPFALTLLFYLFLSMWHTRLAGELRFSKYLEPLLFTIMAMMLVVS